MRSPRHPIAPPILLSALLLGAFAVPAAQPAQITPRALQLRDYFELIGLSDPTMSPDGGQVAFVRSVVDAEADRRHREIWIVATDGDSRPRRLTSPADDATNPVWSPDGTLLAFESSRRPLADDSQPGSTWFLDMTRGGEAFQIEGVWGRPVFSPDSRWIAFTHATAATGEAARRPRGRRRYEIVDDFENRIEEQFDGRIHDWMQYRFDRRGYLPDPRRVSASPPRDVYLVPRAGSEPRRLTRLGLDANDLAWAPDSERLAFTADPAQRDERAYEHDDVWVVDLAGEMTRLTEDAAVNRAPQWSPDGRWITVRRSAGLDTVIESGQGRGSPIDLFRLPTTGGPGANLTEGWDLRPGAHRYSADGGTLFFGGNRGGELQLFATPADGGQVRQVTSGRRWLGGFSFAADTGTFAFTATNSATPAEIYVARNDGSDERRLTDFNDLLSSQVVITGSRQIRFPSTDGTEIEGWVLLPAGYSADAGPFPLILSIHDGPHGAYGERFSFQFQLWATQGYVVLYVNPRGSTGYGEDFLWATWGGWGNLDFEDLMAGVGHVVETFAIDPGRLGVAGYSYGGFLTNWIITHTDRFAAAVSGAGISNWVSDYGTADIPRTKESEFFGAPWETPGGDLLWEQSPIKHAAGVVTPTLFIHAEQDYRVPIEQGEQMYTALHKQGIEARFVRYPDASHGGWRPWDMAHRYLQELRWWEEHLGTR